MASAGEGGETLSNFELFYGGFEGDSRPLVEKNSSFDLIYNHSHSPMFFIH